MPSNKKVKKKTVLLGNRFRAKIGNEMEKMIAPEPSATWDDFERIYTKLKKEGKIVHIKHNGRNTELQQFEYNYLKYLFLKERKALEQQDKDDLMDLINQLLEEKKQPVPDSNDPAKVQCKKDYPFALQHFSLDEDGIAKNYFNSAHRNIFFKSVDNIIRNHRQQDEAIAQINACSSIYEAVKAILEKVSHREQFPYIHDNQGFLQESVGSILKFFNITEYKNFIDESVDFRNFYNRISREKLESAINTRQNATNGSTYLTKIEDAVSKCIAERQKAKEEAKTERNQCKLKELAAYNKRFHNLQEVSQNYFWQIVESKKRGFPFPIDTFENQATAIITAAITKATKILDEYRKFSKRKKKRHSILRNDQYIVVLDTKFQNFVLCTLSPNRHRPDKVYSVGQLRMPPGLTAEEVLLPISSDVIDRIVKLYTVFRKHSHRQDDCSTTFKSFFQTYVANGNYLGFLTVDKVVHHVMKHAVNKISFPATRANAINSIDEYFKGSVDCIETSQIVRWTIGNKGKVYVYFEPLRGQVPSLCIELRKEENWFSLITYSGR